MPWTPVSSDSAVEEQTSVAIIGLACRFSGDAVNPEKFWELLCKTRSAYSEPPRDRFNIDSFHSSRKDRLNTITPRGGHFLRQDVAAFDANFFSIGQSEAMAMDPQQRIMLEIVYEAFENACLPIEDIAGSDTGCFMGNFTTDYREMLFRDPDSAPRYGMSGSGQELISNRVSWFYDLKGPCFTLGTACSSSLVALHQACQSIRTGETSMAIVGGSNLLLNPDMFMALSNQNFLAQGGRCRSFDAAGDGYSRGEGFAAVILKNASDAIRDGDPIRAVIRGTGVNHNGKTTSIARPSADAQAKLISTTYSLAGLEFKDTNYFEAHGTGTETGDPMELEGIAKTIASVRVPGDDLIVGSVKPNIGHLEAVAGLAGLIKGIYILENGVIPPNINFDKPNPRIPFSKWKLSVPTKLRPWPTNGLRRLSVQAFGYGGANAHAILDDARHYLAEKNCGGIHFTTNIAAGHSLGRPTHAQQQLNPYSDNSDMDSMSKRLDYKRLRIFVFSAQDKDGLRRQRHNLAKYIKDRLKGIGKTENTHLRDLAFTLGEKRSRLAWRMYVCASSHEDLVNSLQSSASETVATRPSRIPRVGFVFTGQGAQWPKMGLELLQYRVFRDSIRAADNYLCKDLGCSWSALEELCREGSSSNLNLPAYSQPLCTILQVALVDLLESWNIVPSVIAGHSSGEIAGAYCLGALSRQDAWKIAYLRGLLSSQMKSTLPSLKGAMLAVGASASEADEWISRHTVGEVVIACVNSPSSVTLSGRESSINDMERMLKDAGIFARKLKVDTAYHSPHMEMISVAYLESMRDIHTRGGHDDRKMFSAVTGTLVDAEELGPINWVRNLVSPVLFYDAMCELLQPVTQDTEAAVDVLLEIGPHSALRGPTNQIMQRHGIKGVEYYSVLSRGENAVETALAAAGALFTQGMPISIPCVNDDTSNNFVPLGKPLIDLPSYCWNHSRTFWAESRISKQYRLRGQPSKGLIGAPCSTYGEKEQLWRGFLRVSEEPWVQDHRIQSSILYPAAGYIAMAVEGACQMAATGRIVRELRLKDVQIVAPAVVSEDVETEFILQLRPYHRSTRDDASTWQTFTVSSCNNGRDLRKNCYGLVLVEYEPEVDTALDGEKKLEDENAIQMYSSVESLCQTYKDPKSFYEELSSLGLNYGPTFQNISQIKSMEGQSCCEVTISNAGMSGMSPGTVRPHIIHPSTLDAMFHAVFAAYKHRKGQLKEAMVPKSIDEISISAQMPFEAGSKFKGFSSASNYGFREMVGDLIMLNKEPNSKPCVTLKKFHCTAISGGGNSEDEQLESNAGKLYSKAIWKPALELCSAAEKAFLVNDGASDMLSAESSELIKKSEILALYYIRQALKRVSVDRVPTPHLQELLHWMQLQIKLANTADNHEERAKLLDSEADVEAKTLEAAVMASSTEGKVLCKVGRSLAEIMLGEVEAGQLLRKSGLLDPLFVEMRGMESSLKKVAKLVELMAHTNPHLSVLEIGKSTTGVTTSALSFIGNINCNPLRDVDYVFATSDGVALSKAEEHLQKWKDRIKLTHLDLLKSINGQDVNGGSFDLIIVSDLLIPAQDPRAIFERLRSILKPEGKLCLVQAADPCLEIALTLRCLPGWGSAGAHSLHLGLMEKDSTRSLLERNQFSVDFSVVDSKHARLRQLSLTVATANLATNGVSPDPETILIQPPDPSSKAKEVASCLLDELESQAIKARIVTWGPVVGELEALNCISLLELDSSYLSEISKSDYLLLQKLILSCSSLLWVTALDGPDAALAQGMFRSIRNEVPGKQYRTIALQSTELEAPRRLGVTLLKLAKTSTVDEEFKEEDGMIKVCRFVEDLPSSEEISILVGEDKETVDLVCLENAHGSQKLAIRTQGMLDTLCLQIDEESQSDLGEDEIEIEVKATGLNFRDVMVTMGQIPDTLLGFEASGIITRCGRNVSQFKACDKVCTIGHGAHRTIFRNKAIFCQPMPEGLSFEEAATLPLVHCTAFHALNNIARARPGQTVLIHAAAGGVGQSAVQLAKYLGLEIFATVGSADKRQLIEDVYGVKPDHIFNSRDLSFAKGIMRMTNGRGVDCILNSLSGEALCQSWQCIADFGTFVEIGMKDILNNTGLDMCPFLKDASFTFFNLKHVMTDNSTLMADILSSTFSMLHRGIIRPVSPVNVYPISDVENAFRLLQTGKHRGKIALAWDSKNIVPLLRRQTLSLKLDRNATYLLVGGLGGLGRSLARLLADSGATSLCFISRSGSKSQAAQKLIQQLEDRNIQTHICSCDIANQRSLSSRLEQFSSTMPPIKGVFQCAMVLQDSLFERMNHEQWTTSLQPKVQGTWNLHNLMPHNLDFFITLSSFAALFGNRSQSNYAAAGAYQDALAHYRRARGLKAVTVDLGVMRDVGVIAEKGATDYLKEWELPFGMRETEFHALMKMIIAAEMKTEVEEGGVHGAIIGKPPTQIIHGLATGETVRAARVRTPFYFTDPRFSMLAGSRSSSTNIASRSGAPGDKGTLSIQVAQSKTLAEAAKAITDALVARVAKSLQADISEIDEGRSLHSYGVDSLVGVELANWIFRETKVGVTVFDILATVSIANFARGLAEKSPLFQEGK